MTDLSASLASVAACLLLLSGAAGAWAQGQPVTVAAPADVIAARKDNFHVLSDQMRDIVKGLGNGVPVADMRSSVLAAQAALQRVPGLFPVGSGVGKTDALPVIWTDPASFAATFSAATDRMTELVAAANGSSRDGFGAAAGRMAAACGTCHATFRAN